MFVAEMRRNAVGGSTLSTRLQLTSGSERMSTLQGLKLYSKMVEQLTYHLISRKLLVRVAVCE
jgi:hypothetical protein